MLVVLWKKISRCSRPCINILLSDRTERPSYIREHEESRR